jgi:hypothetical protein
MVTFVGPPTEIGAERTDIQLDGMVVAGSAQTGLPDCVCSPVITGSTPLPVRFTVAEKSCAAPAAIDWNPLPGKRTTPPDGAGDVTLTLASVNVVVATAPEEPVAVTA